jgi:hypothetical protein
MGEGAWPPAYPRAYSFSKALSRLLTEKKLAQLLQGFKKEPSNIYTSFRNFQYFPKRNQSSGNFPKGLTTSPAV